MKKMFCIFLVFFLVAVIFNSSIEAEILRGSNNGYEMDDAITRIECIVLLIRMLGDEDIAADYVVKDLPFTDIPSWGLGYISYSYEYNLIKGISETRFGANMTMGYKSFYTLMLRTLEYNDSEGDFTWNDADLMADKVGISIAKDFTISEFTRNDAIDIMMKTLNTAFKDKENTLQEYLSEVKNFNIELGGLVSEELFIRNQITGSNSSVVKTDSVPKPTHMDKEVLKIEPEYDTSVTKSIVGGIRASEVGLIANNSKQGKSNAIKLNDAINKYGKVIIDGIYYIGDIGEGITAKNIEIIGEGGGELVFDLTKDKIMFGAKQIDNISISEIKFTNISEYQVIIVYSRSTAPTYIDSVEFNHCIFTGDISAFRQKGSKYVDPEEVLFGINSLIFTNNRVTNTKSTFITMLDLPFNEVVISNNQINNFDKLFANISLTNGIKYGIKLREMRRFLRVNNNTVINDDTWWTEEGGFYHAFILVENNEVIYKNNYVEGLKADIDIAVYDAYLSSLQVTYIDNTWVNNICFYDNKFNTLIKAKSGLNGNRLYRDNTFIVEESYATRLGKDLEQLYVQFIDINQDMNFFEITNNIFDVYDLRFQTSSRDVKKYVFKDNTIKAKYASGIMLYTAIVDDGQSSVEFVGNHIDIEQQEYREVTTNPNINRFILVGTTDHRLLSSSKGIDLIIKDNEIIAPIVYAIHSTFIEKMDIANNDIYVVQGLFEKFAYGYYIKDFEDVVVIYQ